MLFPAEPKPRHAVDRPVPRLMILIKSVYGNVRVDELEDRNMLELVAQSLEKLSTVGDRARLRQNPKAA